MHAPGVSPEAAPSPAGFSEPPRSILRDGVFILVVCAIVYWLFLGSTPFAASEGLRIAPGWAMLDSGDWSRTEMFELNYVRKPPGMPWAIAASSWLLGQNEWGARAPSALACTFMALAAFAFGRTWCGPRGGLAAGLAQALLPLMWAGGTGGAGGPGRTAEIEALNTLFTQLAVLPLIGLMMRPYGLRRDFTAAALAAALGIVGFALTKSAASAPCVAGAMIGVCIARRSHRPLFHPAPWVAIIAGSVSAYVLLRHFAAINNDADAVRETGQFAMKWISNPGGWITLIPLAFAAALPMSIALLIPIGKDARAEQESADPAWSRCVLAGRACAFALFASCLLYAAAGLDNARYLMPATVFLAPIVGYIIRGLAGGGTGPFARAGFMDHRREILKRLIFRGPAAWAGVLLGVAIMLNTGSSILPRTTSRATGEALAAALPPGATVWADDLIEARPDILLYARQSAAASGRTLRFIWAKPRMHRAELPTGGDDTAPAFIILRTDDASGEGVRYLPALESRQLRLVHQDTLGKYAFALFRVEPEKNGADPSTANDR